MIKSLLGLSWCAGAIMRHEAARGVSFEAVAYTRQDMLRLEPMRPWCEWTNRTHVVACPLPAHDDYFITPRKHAHALLTVQLEADISCNDTKAFYHVHALFWVPTSCCFSAESVLHHVTHTLTRDPKGCTSGLFVFLRQLQRVGWEHARGSRRFRHVCDVVLSPQYTRPQSGYPKAQLGGVAPEAGLALFALFGNDTAACHAFCHAFPAAISQRPYRRRRSPPRGSPSRQSSTRRPRKRELAGSKVERGVERRSRGKWLQTAPHLSPRAWWSENTLY